MKKSLSEGGGGVKTESSTSHQASLAQKKKKKKNQENGDANFKWVKPGGRNVGEVKPERGQKGTGNTKKGESTARTRQAKRGAKLPRRPQTTTTMYGVPSKVTWVTTGAKAKSQIKTQS